MDRLCDLLKNGGKPYGFGGVGRPGGGMLPAEYILGEHHRLGSGIVILSRSFCNTSIVTDYAEIERTFREGVADVRRWEDEYRNWTEEALLENHRRVGECVAQILARRNA